MLYFYCTDEKDEVQGPVSAGELKRLYSEGLLSSQARVCPEGGAEWSHIQELLRTLVSVPAPPAARKTTATSPQPPSVSPPSSVSPPPLPSFAGTAAAAAASHIPPLPSVTSKPASAASIGAGVGAGVRAGAGARVGNSANSRASGTAATLQNFHLESWILALFLAFVTTAVIFIPIVAYIDREELAHRMKFPDWMIMPSVIATLLFGVILTFVYGLGLQSSAVKKNTSASAASAGQSRSQNPQKPEVIKVTVRQELYIIFGILALAAFILLLVYLGRG